MGGSRTVEHPEITAELGVKPDVFHVLEDGHGATWFCTRKGLTILLTTHDMNQADQLCGRIAIMDKGRILMNDTSAELKKPIPGGNALELRVSLPAPDAGPRILDAQRGLAGVSKVDQLDAGPRARRTMKWA